MYTVRAPRFGCQAASSLRRYGLRARNMISRSWPTRRPRSSPQPMPSAVPSSVMERIRTGSSPTSPPDAIRSRRSQPRADTPSAGRSRRRVRTLCGAPPSRAAPSGTSHRRSAPGSRRARRGRRTRRAGRPVLRARAPAERVRPAPRQHAGVSTIRTVTLGAMTSAHPSCANAHRWPNGSRMCA